MIVLQTLHLQYAFCCRMPRFYGLSPYPLWPTPIWRLHPKISIYFAPFIKNQSLRPPDVHYF